MPNMKSIGLKIKELQSYNVDVAISAGKASWDHFLSPGAPLVIESSCYRDHLLLSKTPLIIETTSCYRDYLLLSRHLLLSETSLVSETTSCYLDYFLLSSLPRVIGNTSCYRDYFLLSRLPLIIGSTSCYRKEFLSGSERHTFKLVPLIIGDLFWNVYSFNPLF